MKIKEVKDCRFRLDLDLDHPKNIRQEPLDKFLIPKLFIQSSLFDVKTKPQFFDTYTELYCINNNYRKRP